MSQTKAPTDQPSLVQKLLGFVILVAVSWFAWSYLFGGSATPKQDPDMTLGAYTKLSEGQRSDYVSQAIRAFPNGHLERTAFLNCMGDYAYRKSPDLLFTEALGWCERERQQDREKFASHFNELKAGDLSADASIICKEYVRAALKAPSTADFPLLDFTATRHAGGHWTIKSYVDSQNGFGATIRSHYICDMKYAGYGDPLDLGAWELLDLKVN